MKKAFYLLFCLLVVSNLCAQTWTGTTSTAWNISTNWSPVGVPIGTSNVIIPGSVASGNWPVFAGNVTINSINMQSGSQLNVNGFTLTLNGINTFIYFTGATLNNSSGGTDIVININTGVGAYQTYFRSNTVNDAIIFNLTGASNSPFFDGDAAPANQYNGNATFNINDALPVYISYIAPSQYNGNLAVNRTVAGGTSLFSAGGNITGNFTYTNNAGSSTSMGVTGTRTNIGGTINISANYSPPGAFEMRRIVNHTTGGIINVQNSQGFHLEKDTLLVTSLSITGYRGGGYGYLWNNAITGNVTIADDASYTGGYYTSVNSNVITGNTSFSNNGTNHFFDAISANTGNDYIGNVTYNSTGTGTFYIAYADALQCSGNLTINRTAAGFTYAFYTGTSAIGGNFSYTNNTAGDTYFGNLVAKTSIGGTVNIAANYTTPDLFEMYRLINQTGGGSINVQNSAGFNLRNDTLIVSTLSITGYRIGAYAYLNDNVITGNVTIADDASYTGGYYTTISNNVITGNTSFSINGTNAFYDSYSTNTGNNYTGNVTYSSAGTGTLYIAYYDALQCSGNLTINRTTAGTTYVFYTGTSTIGGNFSYTNNTAGDTYFGNMTAKTSIGGTINITANFTTPDFFEMFRLINQTGGGSINVQNSSGYNVRIDTLIVTTLNLTGYKSGAYAYLLNNAITGNVATADDASYAGGWATYIRNNLISGNTSITSNGTNLLHDADAGATGNKYIGNVTYTRNGANISVAVGDSNEITQNLTLNSTSGITLGVIKFNGNTNGIIEQSGTQPISIPTLIMAKTGNARLTLNDSVTVTTTATFTSGNIYSSAGNNLIFPDNISYTGASASSHVVGPVTKIGNDTFTFPVGSPTSLNTIAMSAPAGTTNRFRAEYKNQNPASDGFDTGSKAGSFGSAIISKAGYWNVQRLSGATNVTLTLGFATNPYEQYSVLANLKVAHWSGTQWDDHGNGGNTGTPASGTVVNSVPITSFSPFALAGVTNTHFYTYSNPGAGPDGTPVKFGGKGGYAPYSTKQLPSGSYTLDSIFLVANGSSVSFKGKDFYGVEKDDTTITAPVAPTTYITANGNGTVNFKGWRHFVYMKNGSNNIMGAIKDNDLTLGNTTMYTYFSAASVATSPNGNIYLRRSFKITSQYAPAGTRRVRFYILKTEFTNLQAADPTSFPNGINSLTITKYTGPQEDSLFNPIPGGNALIIPNSAITIVDMGTMYSLDIDVTGFSGFYIGGNNSNLNICPGSTITLPSNISGATYQWQGDTRIGGGFSNLTNNPPYSGTNTNALTITNAPSSIYGTQYRCVVNGSNFSQTYTIKINVSWEGTVSTAWENVANWSCGALPDLNTDVIINGAKLNYPQVNANTVIRTMKVSPAASVKVKTGFNLQILK